MKKIRYLEIIPFDGDKWFSRRPIRYLAGWIVAGRISSGSAKYRRSNLSG